MTSQQPIEQSSASMRDSLLLMLSVAALAAGVVAFYYLEGQMNVTLRWLLVLGGLGVGVALAYQTQAGKMMFGHIRGANVELRKTTWPTRQESLQATLMIAVVVLITALVLWGLDSALLKGVKLLTGRS